jgi:RNA polymerase sigma-70 factor, ECF subfamily
MSSSARIPDIAQGPPPGMPLNHGLASDDVLIAAARWGDHQAFAELCERHSLLAKRKILRILRNPEDTEDALQDTLLRAYTHLSSFRQSCKFSTWLTTIGVNSALMMMRKQRGRGERYASAGAPDPGTLELHEIADHSPGPEEIYSKKETSLLVRGAVQALHPRLRSVVDQYYGSESSLEEAARALDISLTAAKSRLGRSRARLRSSLAKRGMSKSGLEASPPGGSRGSAF